MNPEDEARLEAFRAEAAAKYAKVLEDPEGRRRVYAAAMCALAFAASAEGFPRFRRWLTERPAAYGLRDEAAAACTQEGLGTAARVLAGWTILDSKSNQEDT